jgi:tetratricopeptide (TPR) repeat protein
MATSLLGAEMETSPHATVYASLVTLPFDKAPPSAEVVESIPLSVRLETVEIMMVRCHALLKLRRYPDLAAEVERWNFLTQNDATARSPEWLPWSVHVIAGQAHDYFDGTAATKAIDILHQLREKIPSNQPMWLCNVDNALANVFLRRGEFRLAMASLDRIISLIPEAVKAEVALNNTENEDADASCSLLTKAYTCEIYSRQGRILLQAGALFEAADIFESAKILSGEVEASSAHFPTRNNNEVVRLLPCQMQVNEGIFHFSKSRYDHALESFSKAVEILRKDRENNILASKYRSKDWVGPCIVGCQPANVLYNETINNMALSHLYMCKMKDAVDLLEELVCEDPTSFLTERLAFNLCTLYELGSDNATGVRKKKTLQLIAKRFFLHDIGPESFRVQ